MDGSTNSLDDMSADSSAEFPDRVAVMEVRLQAQEDEITLLKSSLADALRRLRLHDQLLPLLKQQLIAVNPSAARVLNQAGGAENGGTTRTLSCSSVSEGLHHPATSQVVHSIVTKENGHIGDSVPRDPRPRPLTLDKSTQTEPTVLGQGSGPDRVPLALTRVVQSLQLEDALFDEALAAGVPRAKLHRVQGLEEEDEEQDDEEDGGTGDRDKEPIWSTSVEEPIVPTTLKGLQREEDLDDSGSQEDQSTGPPPPTSRSPAPPKDQSPTARTTALASVQEVEKKLCVYPTTHATLFVVILLLFLRVLPSVL